MSKIKNGGLDQYGAGPFEQQQHGTAGVEEVKPTNNHDAGIYDAPVNEMLPRNRRLNAMSESAQPAPKTQTSEQRRYIIKTFISYVRQRLT